MTPRGSQQDTGARRPTIVLEIQGSVGTGGSERHTLVLVRGLQLARDFDVIVVGPYSRNPWMLEELQSLDTAYFDMRFTYGVEFLWSLKRVVKVVRHHQVGLIHTHLRIADILGVIAGLLTGVPVVATLHGRTGPLEGSVSLRGKALRRLHAHLLRRGTRRIIAISDFVKEFSIADLHLDPGHVAVVHNCTDPSRFDGDFDVDAFREELGWSPGEKVVSFIGGISRQKGAHHFVEVAHRVARKHPDARFLVAGMGYFEAEMRRRIEEKRLSGRFTFTGWRPDVPRLMRAIDILVVAAHQEGFGRVVTEAMAASKPVVAFASGGVREIVADGETGCLVPYGDVDGMARCVLELLHDEAKCKALGARGRLRLEERFSPKVFVEQTISVLRFAVD